MFVYMVIYSIAYEGDQVLGIFSDYDKARSFELDYIAKWKVNGRSDSTEIRKVELDKVDYGFYVGEEV